jgi:hypothetical protein
MKVSAYGMRVMEIAHKDRSFIKKSVDYMGSGE